MSSSSDVVLVVVVAVAATVVAVRVVTVGGDVTVFSFSEVVEEAEVTALAVPFVTFGAADCFWVDDEMSVLFGCDDAVDDVLVRLVWLPLRGVVRGVGGGFHKDSDLFSFLYSL
jgi:hypothetical protein